MQRLTFIGNCQINALQGIYDRFVGRCRGDLVVYVASYANLSDQGRLAIEQADVIVEQITEFKQKVDSSGLAGRARRVLVPLVSGGFYWPLAGQPHPRNPTPWYLKEGPFDAEYSDAYLNRLIAQNVEPDQAVDRYLKLDVNSKVNLDRVLDLILERQRERDELTGFDVASIIRAKFRNELLFRTPFHPELRITRHLAVELFRRLGVGEEPIERVQRYLTVTPFPEKVLPIHPSVVSHFGLTFIAPKHRYKHSLHGDVTFEEFAHQYVRCEWNSDVEEGIAFIRRGDHDAGFDALQRGVERYPNSCRGLEALALELQRRRRIDEAIATVQRAIELDPTKSSLHYRLGDLLHRAGDLAAAVAEFRRVRELDPSDHHALAVLAAWLTEQGRLDEAIDVAREALLFAPWNADLHFQLGRLLQRNSALQDAENAFRKAVELDPGKEQYRSELDAIIDRRRRLATAEESLCEALRADPADAAARLSLCDRLIEQRRFDEALPIASEGLQQVALTAENASALGAVLRRLGDLVSAEHAYRVATQLQPGSADYQAALSRALSGQSKWGDALAVARIAWELAPASGEIAADYARLLRQHGEVAEAERVLEAAVAAAPSCASANALLGQVRAQLGKNEEALEAVRRAVELEPRHAPYLIQLANMLRERGQLAEAEQALRTAVNADPSYPEGYATLTRLLIEQGRRGEAVPAAKRAAELDPRNKHYVGQLGNLLWAGRRVGRRRAGASASDRA